MIFQALNEGEISITKWCDFIQLNSRLKQSQPNERENETSTYWLGVFVHDKKIECVAHVRWKIKLSIAYGVLFVYSIWTHSHNHLDKIQHSIINTHQQKQRSILTVRNPKLISPSKNHKSSIISKQKKKQKTVSVCVWLHQ